jgi:hypothetical protein
MIDLFALFGIWLVSLLQWLSIDRVLAWNIETMLEILEDA